MTAPALSVLRWEKPAPTPPGNTGRRPTGRYDTLAAQLRQHPGRWAVTRSRKTVATSLVGHIRHGQLQAFTPTGDYDATSRRIGDTWAVYARYLDSESAP